MATLGMHRRLFEGRHLVDTSMERSSQILHSMETQKFDFFFFKFEIRILTRAEKLKSS